MINFKFLIVILIALLVLAAVGLAFLSARSTARDEQRVVDLGVMQKALQIFFKENGFYPYGSNVEVPTGMDTYVDRWPQDFGPCRYLYSQKDGGNDFTLNFCQNGKVHILTAKGAQ